MNKTFVLIQNAFFLHFYFLRISYAYQYKLSSQELTAPEMLCFSGDAQSKAWSSALNPYACPSTPEEVKNYPAVIMDESGYAKVVIRNIKLRDDGRRRQKYQSKEEGSDYRNVRSLKIHKEIIEFNETIKESIYEYPHHLQIYLVHLDSYSKIVSRSQCCYEVEMAPPLWLHKSRNGNFNSPKECSYSSGVNGLNSALNDSFAFTFAHDYRVNVPRVGPMGYASAPMKVNAPDNDSEINIIVTLKPESNGRYMVVISNCAAEINIDPTSNATLAKGLKISMKSIEVTFVSRFGELPLSMMGIIPFYGFMAICYSILSFLWLKKSGLLLILRWLCRRNFYRRNTYGENAITLVGIQRAIRFLVFCQACFSILAFTYYLYLNGTTVDADVLYYGTAAALVSRGPWSVVVALTHFGTILGCQIVATLATDGMWLIQNSVHQNTKIALYIMVCVWLFLIFLYGRLSVMERRILLCLFGGGWIVFLMTNVRRSLRHLRSLMVGQSTDKIMAVGGAIVAKRSMYRKMCVVVGVYPIIFSISFVWTASTKDSWAWVGYVLVDLYLFILLCHASITWLPRPMVGQEYAVYAPLEIAQVNDMDMWEGNLENEGFVEEEFEMYFDSIKTPR